MSSEHVRLVIWDLDETFWRGTLTEGGIQYLQSHHDIVVQLARRGIISSICSRNDHGQVEAVLRDAGLWEYFVFPSIDWTAKGPRLKAMVDAVQLRPTTVMFVDDNPMNRAEAAHFVEGLQTASPEIIRGMLDNPLFQGRIDPGLTRLWQYRLLERRGRDMDGAIDTCQFLRDSDIRVFIDHEVEANLDRAIELINRANQLNFTKQRLSEDMGEARRELRALLNEYHIQAGLIRVVDRYGDYGYCGLYVHSKTIHAEPELIHYCFSCRTLGMQVETWLYERLGRPHIAIRGETLTNIRNPETGIDWIRLESAPAPDRVLGPPSVAKIPRIFMRGGCELVAMSHYFELLTDSLVTEFPFNRDALPIRRDHSQMLSLALKDLSPMQMASLRALGYHSSDFETTLLEGEEAEVWILSFWADLAFPLFRHRELGFRVPLHAHPLAGGDLDLTRFDLQALRPELRGHWLASAIAEIRTNYEFEGLVDGDLFESAVSEILQRLPKGAVAFVLGPGEKILQPDGALVDLPRHIDVNRRLRALVDRLPDVTLLFIEDYVASIGDRQVAEPNHFARHVYFKLYKDVEKRIGAIAGR